MTIRGCFLLHDGAKPPKDQYLRPDCFNMYKLSDLKTLYPSNFEQVHKEMQMSPRLAHEVRICSSQRCNRFRDTYCPNTLRKQTFMYWLHVRDQRYENARKAVTGGGVAVSRLYNALPIIAGFICSLLHSFMFLCNTSIE